MTQVDCHIEYCSVHKPPAGYTIWKTPRGKHFWVTGNVKPPEGFAASVADDYDGKFTKPHNVRRDMDRVREVFGKGSLFDWSNEEKPKEKPKLMHKLPDEGAGTSGQSVKEPAHGVMQTTEKEEQQKESSGDAKPIVAATSEPPSERSPSVPSANPNELVTQFFGKPPVQ